jgi:hypothetical protein
MCITVGASGGSHLHSASKVLLLTRCSHPRLVPGVGR